MPTISVDIAFDKEYRPDPDSWLDWVLFVILCASSVFLLGSCMLLFYLRRFYDPLRYKNIPKLTYMAVFGCIHMWSTFINNQHLEILEPTQVLHCAFWGYWMQYAVGLCGWFFVLLKRILLYGKAYRPAYRDMPLRQKRALDWSLCLAVILPIWGICIGLTSTGGSSYDPELETCYSGILWKVLVAVWVMLCCVMFFTCNRLIIQSIGKAYLNEYKPFNSIILMGIFTIIVKAPIHFFGMTGHVSGRLIDSSAVIFLHLFCFFKLIGYVMVKALKNDTVYAHDFRSEIVSRYPELTSVKSLFEYPDVEESILGYCATRRSFGVLVGKFQVTVSPANVVFAYKEIVRWKNDGCKDKPLAAGIITEYLNQYGKSYCGLSQSIWQFAKSEFDRLPPYMFDSAKVSLIDLMDSRWGRDYLQNALNDRMTGETPAARTINTHVFAAATGMDRNELGIVDEDISFDKGTKYTSMVDMSKHKYKKENDVEIDPENDLFDRDTLGYRPSLLERSWQRFKRMF